jgi:hypothetical protein
MKRSVLLCISVLLAGAGCKPAPVAPILQADGFDVAGKEGDFVLFPYQLRPADGSGSTAWGELELWVGFPPSPVVPPSPVLPSEPVMVLRGVLHNPAGETLMLADVALPDGSDGIEVRVAFEYPPNPCSTTFFEGSASLVGYPNPGPPGAPGVTLVTSAGALVGYPSPGPPDVFDEEAGPPIIVFPEGGGPGTAMPNPGPPEVPGACLVTDASRAE